MKSRNNHAVPDVADRISKAPATVHDQGTASSLAATRKAPATFTTNERHDDPPKRVNLENRVVVASFMSVVGFMSVTYVSLGGRVVHVSFFFVCKACDIKFYSIIQMRPTCLHEQGRPPSLMVGNQLHLSDLVFLIARTWWWQIHSWVANP